MPEIERSHFCCGVREIGELDNKGADVVRAIYAGINKDDGPDLDGAFWWWADNTDSENGRKLAAYFKKYELGKVTKMGAAHNPQSGNELEMWVLELDHDALDKWIEKYGE
jgi:hypothetical protein